MNTGIGLALGSWASTAVLALASCAVYRYRIAVEERTLLAVVGEPYRQFMATRRRRRAGSDQKHRGPGARHRDLQAPSWRADYSEPKNRVA